MNGTGAHASPNPSLRILHCIPDMLNGGSQRQLVYLALEQARRGSQVHIISSRSGPTAALLDGKPLGVSFFQERRSHDPRLLLDMSRLIRRFRPDVVQTWLLQMDVVGGLAASLGRIPWVLSERSAEKAYDRSLKERLRILVANTAGAIVANSAGGLAYWKGRAREGVGRHVIPNIVPLQAIEGAEPIDETTLSLPQGHRMILSVGRFSPIKNLPRLIAALGRLSQRVPLVGFLCGDGTHPEQVAEAIRSAGAGGLVRLPGYRSDVWRWMKRADLLISVSVVEGQENAVLEAMAAGCPVVLSDIPSHREIADEACAVFVDPLSVESIADGIERSLADPAAARLRASAARERVRSLSASTVASRFEEVYRTCVE